MVYEPTRRDWGLVGAGVLVLVLVSILWPTAAEGQVGTWHRQEANTASTTGATVTKGGNPDNWVTDARTQASGGSVERYWGASGQTPGEITFSCTRCDGLRYYAMRAADGAVHAIHIDGSTTAEAQTASEVSETVAYQVLVVEWTFGTPGAHSIRLRQTGGDYIRADAFEWREAAAETTTTTTAPTTTTTTAPTTTTTTAPPPPSPDERTAAEVEQMRAVLIQGLWFLVFFAALAAAYSVWR